MRLHLDESVALLDVVPFDGADHVLGRLVCARGLAAAVLVVVRVDVCRLGDGRLRALLLLFVLLDRHFIQG